MIRPAAPSDLPELARLIRAFAEYERLSGTLAFTEERLRDHLFGPRPFAEVFLAEDAGRAVGFAVFYHTYSTFLGRPGIWLEDLFVDEAHRGKGYGKALFAAVARAALERGCARLEWLVLDWNEPAIGFYRSLGSVALDDRTVRLLTGEGLRAAAGGWENCAP